MGAGHRGWDVCVGNDQARMALWASDDILSSSPLPSAPIKGDTGSPQGKKLCTLHSRGRFLDGSGAGKGFFSLFRLQVPSSQP